MAIRHELARFCAHLTFDALSEEIVEHTKIYLLDHIISMILGPKLYLEDRPDIAALMKELGGKEESSILGHRGRYPCLNATLVNTTIGFTGLVAIHKGTVIHVPEVLFPAAFAVAERQKSSGRDLILAIVVGTEIMTRVGISLGTRNIYARGFHPTSICGPFGCAVTAGKLLGLGEGELAEALSIAGVQGAGSSVWSGGFHPASVSFQQGKAAQSGVWAALLAQIGFNGIDAIFEDERGFLKAHSENPDPTRLTEALGERWESDGLILKQYAFGNLGLTSIEALLELLQTYEITGDDIAEMTVTFPTVIAPLICHSEYPVNRGASLINFRYVLAVVAYAGNQAAYNLTLSDIQHRKDARVISLFNRIKAGGDPELDKVFPQKEPCMLSIKTKDGEQFSLRNDGPVKGDPEDPFSAEEIEAKFNRLVEPVLGGGKSKRIVNAIKQLDTVENVSDLVPLWANSD